MIKTRYCISFRFGPDAPMENPTYLNTSATPSVQYSAMGPRDTPITNHAPKAGVMVYQVPPIKTKGPSSEGEVGGATYELPKEKPMAYEIPVPVLNTKGGRAKRVTPTTSYNITS